MTVPHLFPDCSNLDRFLGIAIPAYFILRDKAKRKVPVAVWFALLGIWIVIQAYTGLREGLTAGVTSALVLVLYLIKLRREQLSGGQSA